MKSNENSAEPNAQAVQLDELWQSVGAAASAFQSGANLYCWTGQLPPIDGPLVAEAVNRGWFSNQDQAAFDRLSRPELAGRLAARRIIRRMIVAVHQNCLPQEVQIFSLCHECGKATHGQPALNLSESFSKMSTAGTGNHFAVAVSTHSIGVDIESKERVAQMGDDAFADALGGWGVVKEACGDHDSNAEVWAAYEAITKSLGKGFLAKSDEISAHLPECELLWPSTEDGLVLCLASSAPNPILQTANL